MMQIVQELCKRPSLNGTCFDMPTIFIPNPNKVSHYPYYMPILVQQIISQYLSLTLTYNHALIIVAGALRKSD